jgi:hypothetical protein
MSKRNFEQAFKDYIDAENEYYHQRVQHNIKISKNYVEYLYKNNRINEESFESIYNTLNLIEVETWFS